MRHTRQSRLAEVGSERQKKLASSEARVRAVGFAGEIEARYLAGAGIGSLLVGDVAQARAGASVDPSVRTRVMELAENSSSGEVTTPLPQILAALDPAARDVGEGAYRALQTLRSLLAES